MASDAQGNEVLLQLLTADKSVFMVKRDLLINNSRVFAALLANCEARKPVTVEESAEVLSWLVSFMLNQLPNKDPLVTVELQPQPPTSTVTFGAFGAPPAAAPAANYHSAFSFGASIPPTSNPASRSGAASSRHGGSQPRSPNSPVWATAKAVLVAADKYDMPLVNERCEKWLVYRLFRAQVDGHQITMSSTLVYEWLLLCRRYNLTELGNFMTAKFADVALPDADWVQTLQQQAAQYPEVYSSQDLLNSVLGVAKKRKASR